MMRPLGLLLALALALAPSSASSKAKKKAARREPPAAAAAPAPPAAAEDEGASDPGPAPVADSTPEQAPRSPPPKPAAAARPALAARASDGDTGDAKESPPPPPAAAPGPSVDLQKLRADYDRLRDELYRARARAQLVQGGLYASKLAATLRWKGAPDYVIRRAEIRLDGASIWDSGDKPVGDDLIKVAERPIKPGQHALTLHLEIRPGTKKGGKEAEQLGYASEHTFAIVVPDTGRTTVMITGDEDGDPPEYEPEIEVELETEK